MAVVMITPFRKLYVYWLCLYNGFCLGICMTKAVMFHGAGGVVMVLVWLFPHYLLYIMTVLLMCHYFLNRIDTLRRTVIIVSMSLLLTLIGTFTESYINPDIMKMFLNKVCNLLVTRLNITFNHNTLNKLLNISRVMAAMKNFLDNTDLLKILLT